MPTTKFGSGQAVTRREDDPLLRGAGRYVKRPAFAPVFEALKRQAKLHVPQPVARAV